MKQFRVWERRPQQQHSQVPHEAIQGKGIGFDKEQFRVWERAPAPPAAAQHSQVPHEAGGDGVGGPAAPLEPLESGAVVRLHERADLRDRRTASIHPHPSLQPAQAQGMHSYLRARQPPPRSHTAALDSARPRAWAQA